MIFFSIVITCIRPDGEFFRIRTKNISPARPIARWRPAAPSRSGDPGGPEGREEGTRGLLEKLAGELEGSR
jgi:hypothetical protein